MTLPPLALLRRNDTHRLVPAKHGAGEGSVLTRVPKGASYRFRWSGEAKPAISRAG